MNMLTRAPRPNRHHIVTAALFVTLAIAAALLIWADQLAAAALLALIVLLVRAIERRDIQAQALARLIADDQASEKVEVPHGAWGELTRAVNGLLQERRVAERLREALPEPLPLAAVHSLLGGDLSTGGQSRPVAVLLVSAPVRAPAWEHGVRRGGLAAWQSLARASQLAAQRYGALLQPCGDAVMLVFGAFEECPAQESLRAAVDAAGLLQQSWLSLSESGSPLSLALASGHALAAALPGLGFCVVGTPVEQAVGMQQLANRARRFGLMCSEEAYQSLRRERDATWEPTDLRVSIANRPPQVVYRWGDVS
jgi:class 3 adenylate cyclase